MGSSAGKDDYRAFLRLTPKEVQDVRETEWAAIMSQPAATMDQYFLHQSMQFLQMMREDFEDAILLFIESSQDQQAFTDTTLDRMLAGLRQSHLLQKCMQVVLDKSLFVAAKYLKWLEQDDITFRGNFSLAMERLEYILDPETMAEFDCLEIQGYEALLQSPELHFVDASLGGGGGEKTTAPRKSSHDGIKFEADNRLDGELSNDGFEVEDRGDGGDNNDHDLDWQPEVAVKLEQEDLADMVPHADNVKRRTKINAIRKGRPRKPTLYTCTYCGKTNAKRSKHIVHLRVHTQERPFKCVHCPKAFRSVDGLNEHKNIHRDETFTCNLCSKTTKNRKSLSRHMRRMHNLDFKLDDLKKEQCDKCDRRYLTKEELAEHVVIHEGFKCDACGMNFKYPNVLKRHQKTKCLALLDPDFSKRRKRTRQKKASKGRVSNHDDDEDDQDDGDVGGGRKKSATAADDDDVVFPCLMCGKIMDRLELAHQHMLREHGIHSHVEFSEMDDV